MTGWAESGLMTLSGPPDGAPCGPPSGLVPGVLGLGQRIEAVSPVRLDWLALLGERAALDGLTRRGRTSCGGATRLLETADDWIAVSLSRPDDIAALPAWIGVTDPDDVPGAVRARRATDLVDQASLLGLPVARLGERRGPGVVATRVGAADPRPIAGARVVDLSALWAGPLCTSILALAGADVVKVESTTRPDAARTGSPGLFARLNGDKEHVALDLGTATGRSALARLVAGADVVVEASRPRALAQLGVVATDELARPGGPQVWVSITGHGRASPRVAFGDDAAVAGGLVVDDGGGPWFCADAVADPLSGLAAAASALEALADGGRWLLDVAMAGVAADHAGPTVAPPAGIVATPPRARC